MSYTIHQVEFNVLNSNIWLSKQKCASCWNKIWIHEKPYNWNVVCERNKLLSFKYALKSSPYVAFQKEIKQNKNHFHI